MESKNPLQKDDAGDGKQKLPPDGDEMQLRQEERDANSDRAPATTDTPGKIEVPAHRADAGTVAAAKAEGERTGAPVEIEPPAAAGAETRDRRSAPENRGATGTPTATPDRELTEREKRLRAKDPFKESPGGPKSVARNKDQPGGLGKSQADRDRQFNER